MKKACQTLKDSTNVLWSLEGQVIQNGPIKTSKSDWPPDGIKTEKIISTSICTCQALSWTLNLFEVPALLDVDIVPSWNPVQYQGKLIM